MSEKAKAIAKRYDKMCDICLLLDSQAPVNTKFFLYKEAWYHDETDKYLFGHKKHRLEGHPFRGMIVQAGALLQVGKGFQRVFLQQFFDLPVIQATGIEVEKILDFLYSAIYGPDNSHGICLSDDEGFGFGFKGSGFWVWVFALRATPPQAGFSRAADGEAVSLIEKETLKSEYRISNTEFRMSK